MNRDRFPTQAINRLLACDVNVCASTPDNNPGVKPTLGLRLLGAAAVPVAVAPLIALLLLLLLEH